MGPVITHADVGGADLVLRGDAAEFLKRLLLGEGLGEIQRASETDLLRDGLADQLLQRGGTQRAEHRGDAFLLTTEMAAGEASEFENPVKIVESRTRAHQET